MLHIMLLHMKKQNKKRLNDYKHCIFPKYLFFYEMLNNNSKLFLSNNVCNCN